MNKPAEETIPARAKLAGTEMPALIKTATLCFHLGVNSTTIWRWVRENNFPEPMSVGLKMRYWKTADVDDWLNRQTKLYKALNEERRLKLGQVSNWQKKQ